MDLKAFISVLTYNSLVRIYDKDEFGHKTFFVGTAESARDSIPEIDLRSRKVDYARVADDYLFIFVHS